MVMLEQRTSAAPVADLIDEVDAGPATDEAAERRLRTLALSGAGVFAAILVGFWAWWPAGVVIGLVAGTLAVLHVGRAMQAHAFADSVDGLPDASMEEELREDLDRLRAELGDDWSVFRRAAVLVTRAQWASVAGAAARAAHQHGRRAARDGAPRARGLRGPVPRQPPPRGAAGPRPRRRARSPHAGLSRLLKARPAAPRTAVRGAARRFPGSSVSKR